jgi:hypothetical protein
MKLLKISNTVLQHFFDVSQASDKVWLTRFLYKLRWSLPLNYFIVKSYLRSRHLTVNECTELSSVNACLPEDSALCHYYNCYTLQICQPQQSTTETFADDTAVPATGSDPAIASQKLQTNLIAIMGIA